MQQNLKKEVTGDTASKVKKASVQVKSVSSSGNIKIALKGEPETQGQSGTADKQSKLEVQQPSPKPKSDNSAAKPSQAKNAKPKAKAQVTNTKAVRDPANFVAPTSLQSAASQTSQKVNLPGTLPSKMSSLKKLGLAAAVLGVLALGLTVLQFTGNDKARAQDIAVAEPTVSPSASLANAIAQETVRTAAAQQPVAEPKPEIKADETVEEKPAEVAVVKDIPVSEPQPVIAVSAAALAPVPAAADVATPASQPVTPEKSDDIMSLLTTGTLAALRSHSGDEKPAETTSTHSPEHVAAVTNIYVLVTTAVAQGQSDAEIDRMLNRSFAAGEIDVPPGLVGADGHVDSATILSLFVGK